LLLIPLLLFAINKEFEEKYLSNVENYKSEINRSKLLKYDINFSKIEIDLNKTVKDVKFKKIENKDAFIQAGRINRYLKSKKYKKNIEQMKQYILYDKKIDFSKYIPKKLSPNFKNSILGHNEKIYVVISSSMPISTIQNYFKTAQKANRDIVFIIRGFVGNDIRKIKPTLKWMSKILTKNPHKKPSNINRYNIILQINPKVTQYFKITAVPAVIYVKNYSNFLDDYNSLPDKEQKEEAYIAYGDANLIYILEKINKEAKSKHLERLIEKMRGNFF
jgi:type-F conjugative transfer system pilin assembly protein TrbC